MWNNVFKSDIVTTTSSCATQETTLLQNDQPRVVLEDVQFISHLFLTKQNGCEKWKIINDKNFF